MTREQASYVHKKVETGEIINTDTIQQEMEQEQLNKIDDTSGETSPHQELIINNAEKIEPLMTQMKQCSILSNILSYIQHDRHHAMNHTLNVRAMNKYRHNLETKEEEEFIELVIDIRLLGYYKIKQGILQQILIRYYKCEKKNRQTLQVF